MTTRVRDLVDEPSLRLDLVVAGDLDRVVRWVHVTELADASPYLVRDEFVLTAGVWRGRGTSAADFVRALESRDIAGIGYGLLAEDERVPPALVRACRADGVTLAVVPVATPFVAVSQWFVERLARDREAPLQQALELGRALLAAADDDDLPGGDAVSAVCRRLRRSLGREVWVTHPGGAVLGRAARTRSPADGVEGLEHHPLTSGGRQIATLVLGSGPASDGLQARSAVDLALPVLGLVLARRRAVRESERRLSGEVVSLVLSRQVEAATVRLRSYGLDPHGPLAGIVLAVADRDAGLGAVEEWIERHDWNAIVALRGDEVQIVVADPGDLVGGARALTAAADATACGVGAVVEAVESLRRSLVQARQACELARRSGTGTVVSHDRTGSHTLLLALQDADILEAFRAALLAPVEEYDASHGTDLVTTLRAFLEHDGRWQETADGLHLHVNTLRQRLTRIEALTGRRVDSTPDRVDLWLALQTAPGR